MSGMLSDMAVWTLVASLMIVFSAGFVKGAVGFALPMILISGIGSFMPAEIAVAALILPTVTANLIQAFRQGFGHAWASFRRFWLFNLVLFVMILLSAQLVRVLPQSVLFSLLGAMISIFASLQLAGWKPQIRQGFERITEVSVAMLAGFFGGLTGVWGPPTILYLTALNVPKKEHVRVQGVVYLLGSILLLGAHLKSGVLNAQTLPFSALLVVPALLGQLVGLSIHDRMNQVVFRRLTLIVLVVAGANLLRRGLLG
ncbi:MAG: sulfite exporter TauE/SafE family protein [Alphaproteobacteria bacterium]|nr:sulfite exporter TauE/SafE family protein [Alphaproteobacteria bacterium]